MGILVVTVNGEEKRLSILTDESEIKKGVVIYDELMRKLTITSDVILGEGKKRHFLADIEYPDNTGIKSSPFYLADRNIGRWGGYNRNYLFKKEEDATLYRDSVQYIRYREEQQRQAQLYKQMKGKQ